MSDNYVLDILLAEDNNYMGTGFSKKQYQSLKELIDQCRHPQRIPASPTAAPLATHPQISPPAQLARPVSADPPTAPPQRPPAPKTDLQATLAELSKGIRRLNDQFDRLGYPPARPLAAPPPAHKPCAPASSELPPQPTSAPVPAPAPARSFPPSPSVEDIEEVEEKQVYKIPLRNVKKMRQKHGHRASKKMHIRVSKFFENCIGLPSKFGAVNMCFSRDEDPDAWYTTMLNHKQKIEALPNRI